MGNGCNLRVITMRGQSISFHGPVNSGEAGGHRSKPKLCWHELESKISCAKRNDFCFGEICQGWLKMFLDCCVFWATDWPCDQKVMKLTYRALSSVFEGLVMMAKIVLSTWFERTTSGATHITLMRIYNKKMNLVTFWFGGISKWFGGAPCPLSWREPWPSFISKQGSSFVSIYLAIEVVDRLYLHRHAFPLPTLHILYLLSMLISHFKDTMALPWSSVPRRITPC